MNMKKTFAIGLAAATLATGTAAFASCGEVGTIYVATNAFFAPFEYYDGTEIVGVDIDIMDLVGKKLNKKVVVENMDFGIIFDNVSQGKTHDCGAAGITITDERKEIVDFSTPYFTSIQYVVCAKGAMEADGKDGDVSYVLWDSLAGKTIGVQTDTTGDLYVDGEINATEDNDGYDGVLFGTGTKRTQMDSAQLACDAIGSLVDVVVIDKLPAEYIVNKSSKLECFALYYDAETATQEEYAICVTKGNTELLNAINEVLAELGKSGIDALVSKHLGLK